MGEIDVQPYPTPGLYFEDVFPEEPRRFTTETPVFLGLTALQRSANAADRPVRSFGQFVELYGANASRSLLGLAVRGFFDNGGESCFIQPLGGEPSGPLVTAGAARTIAGLEPRFDQALEGLEHREGFDLLLAPELGSFTGDPDGVTRLQARLVTWASRRGDCFVILDALPFVNRSDKSGWMTVIRDPQAQTARLPVGEEGGLAALYHPWLKVPGACKRCLGEGSIEGAPCGICAGGGAGWVPPSGHVAGMYARVGPGRAPANQPLVGVVDLDDPVAAESARSLTAAGVNPLRILPGRGVCAWGSVTLERGDSAADIGARRMRITICRWAREALRVHAFEPHDERLRLWIVRTVRAFLERLYRRGLLLGATPAEAYFVKCDAENNPARVREAGEVVVDVGVALGRPLEFLVVRLVHGREGIATVSL